MSSRPSDNSSPSNSSEPTSRRATSVIPEALNQQATSNDDQNSEETPQPTAGPRSQSAPPDLLLARRSTAPLPRPTAPLIIIIQSPEPHSSSDVETASRQGRPSVARRGNRNSSSQPPRRSTTPYARPGASARARSQPRSVPTTTTATMSSASSSPGNTSTAGATSGSGSNPSYQLPYAPFPYPMPANGRGSGQQQGGSNSGK